MENRTNFTTSSYENLDTNELSLYWKRIDMSYIVFCSLWSVLGTIGNGLVICITGFRMKKTVHTVWILNLAVADFTFSIFLPFTIVNVGLEFHWPFGPIMCKLQEAIAFLNLFGSIYTMMVISIDRRIVVCCPVWARNHRTSRLASFVVLGVWILALVLSFPYLYFKESRNDDERNTITCSYDYEALNKEGILYPLALFQFMFGFIIPFSVIAVCYGATVARLRRSQLSQSSRPFKVITAVIVAFLVCWLPFHLFSVLQMDILLGSKNTVLNTCVRLSYSLAYCNSCLNPILYFCMGHNFEGKLTCSFLSAFKTAVSDESNHSTRNTKVRSSAELESLKL